MMNYHSLLDTILSYQPTPRDETDFSAAVMVLILENDNKELEILLTKRAALSTYAGDYSFPGGIRETTDVDLLCTAQRELQEELNIEPGDYQYIGQLDDFEDRQKQLVRPFVALMQKKVFEENFIVSAAEISSLYYFPINKLHLITENPHLHNVTRRTPSYSYVDGEVFIWGLTAAILVHFANLIRGENKPTGKHIGE